MFTKVISCVEALPNYEVLLTFHSGSRAIVNLKKRLNSMRLEKLNDPECFNSVSTDGVYVIWKCGVEEIRVSVDEMIDTLLNSM